MKSYEFPHTLFESCMLEYFMGGIDKDIFSPMDLV